ncbi:MAG TPA: glucose-1-phosphate cytidylyltransferase [Candidatus Limnocylindrales bacterium]|nr:glucose-1-phosphate cytidylyltransferase [Candidatus Limnocylindrales bacterium]
MKVVILCGGLGTRLREETEFRPKPMVKIGTKPILWHIMKLYAHYGFKDFVLCLGYKGEIIKEYFYHYEMYNSDFSVYLGKQKSIEVHNSHNELDWHVALIDTGEKALKGARIKRIEHLIEDEHFLLTYGDGVANLNIKQLVEFHLRHGRIGTVTGVRPPSLFGELQVRGDQVELFTEKPQTSSGLISGGFFAFSRKIFDYLSSADDCDFEPGPLEKLAQDGQLMVYEHRGEWACVDTYRDLEHLNHLWFTNRAFWKVWA